MSQDNNQTGQRKQQDQEIQKNTFQDQIQLQAWKLDNKTLATEIKQNSRYFSCFLFMKIFQAILVVITFTLVMRDQLTRTNQDYSNQVIAIQQEMNDFKQNHNLEFFENELLSIQYSLLTLSSQINTIKNSNTPSPQQNSQIDVLNFQFNALNSTINSQFEVLNREITSINSIINNIKNSNQNTSQSNQQIDVLNSQFNVLNSTVNLLSQEQNNKLSLANQQIDQLNQKNIVLNSAITNLNQSIISISSLKSSSVKLYGPYKTDIWSWEVNAAIGQFAIPKITYERIIITQKSIITVTVNGYVDSQSNYAFGLILSDTDPIIPHEINSFKQYYYSYLMKGESSINFVQEFVKEAGSYKFNLGFTPYDGPIQVKTVGVALTIKVQKYDQ